MDLRTESNTLRSLKTQNNFVDFSSNDYLGFAHSEKIFNKTHRLVKEQQSKNGSTGSRLLSGNHSLHVAVEQEMAAFFNAETALLFNSGYDANIGLFSSILLRGDLVLYDQYIHASIRDGIKMANAKAYHFKHNDLNDLEKLLKRVENNREIYVVTEAVFSMDGDAPDLIKLSKICQKHNAHLIVDEAHATGVMGETGLGLVKELGLEKEVFARIHTFGKALGCHGAIVLGSEQLKRYLINFARSLIYTTAIPLHTVATIKVAVEQLVFSNHERIGKKSQIQKLQSNIAYFNSQLKNNNLQLNFIKSHSAIHCCIIPGNEKIKRIAQQLQENTFDVKPILSPTVLKGQERLRICLHSYNSKKEIKNLLILFDKLNKKQT